VELRRASGLRVAAGCAFGAGEVAASFFLLADGAPFGCCLAAELDDGGVVEAVGVGEIAASAVVGVALGVFLGCAGPAVAVAPEMQACALGIFGMVWGSREQWQPTGVSPTVASLPSVSPAGIAVIGRQNV